METLVAMCAVLSKFRARLPYSAPVRHSEVNHRLWRPPRRDWGPRTRPPFRLALSTYSPLLLWPPCSDLKRYTGYCASGGFGRGFLDEQHFRHSAHSRLRSSGKSPRVTSTWPIYDGVQNPHVRRGGPGLIGR
ncbi:unnamed protein product [Leuciscus chuanchicus]